MEHASEGRSGEGYAELRAAAGELLDAMTDQDHYSDPAGCDERTERAMSRVAQALKARP